MTPRGLLPPIVAPGGLFGFTIVASADLAPFDPSPISNVRHYIDGPTLFVRWDSTADPGTYYQIYINGRLVWEGTERHADLAYSVPAGSRAILDVGTIGRSNHGVDFSGSFTHDGNRAALAWSGGRYLDETLKGFSIYQSTAPGLPYAPGNRVGNVAAAPGGQWNDGYGVGGYGRGGYGRSAITYGWTSGVLRSGTWQYAVAAYDDAGNESADPPTFDVVIVAPPPGPVPRADGKRLWIEDYDATANVYTLGWIVPT
jgi:hypothetical protein